MKKKKFILICIVFGLSCVTDQSVAKGRYDENKSNESKKLFLEANIALSQKRYADAHAIAERLIRDYAGDYQISLYLRLYANTFYFLDEDFQKGMLQPTPPGIQKRVEQLKAKQDKTVIDLVKLVWVGNGPGGNFSTEYLQEILYKFPGSVWRDWAEWMLIQEMEYSPREKYQDKSAEERSKLLMRDLYNACRKFINDHADSYMIPGLLEATARWAYSSGDTTVKEEAIQICRRVLKDYPNAEYDCAEARRTLREILGNNYKETPGCSAELDKVITQFYCLSPEPDKQKKWTTQYLSVVKQTEKESKIEERAQPGISTLSKLSYILSLLISVIVIVFFILLLKKKAASRGK